MAFEKRNDLFYRDSFSYLIVAISLFLVSFAFLYVGNIDKKFTGHVAYTPDWCDYNVCAIYHSSSDSPFSDCIADRRYLSDACDYCLSTYGCAGSSSSFGSSSVGSEGPRAPSLSEISSSKSYVSVTNYSVIYAQNIFQIISRVIPELSSSFVTSSSASPTHNIPDTSSSTTAQSSCSALSCQQNMIILVQQKLMAVEFSVKSQLKASQVFMDKYEDDPTIKHDYDFIQTALSQIQQINSHVNSQLSIVTNQLVNLAQEKTKTLDMEEQKDEEVKEYYSDYTQNAPPVNEDISDGCKIPLNYMIFKEVLPSGKSIKDGELCDFQNSAVSPVPLPFPIRPVKPIPNLSGSQNLPSSGTISSILVNGNSPVQVSAFLLNDPETWGTGDVHEAITIVENPDGLDIVFLSAPSHSALKEKIDEFVQNLLFDTSDSESEENLGFTSKTFSQIETYKKNVPYFLWIILITLFITLFILGKLIFSQNKIDQNLNGKQNVSFKNNFNFGGHHLSVEKMIRDALKEYPKNKKIITARLSVISEAYKNLSESYKKKLAPLYEELVYLVKEIN